MNPHALASRKIISFMWRADSFLALPFLWAEYIKQRERVELKKGEREKWNENEKEFLRMSDESLLLDVGVVDVTCYFFIF